MAVNFPNFLGQAKAPDLSGIGDFMQNRQEAQTRMYDNAMKEMKLALEPKESEARVNYYNQRGSSIMDPMEKLIATDKLKTAHEEEKERRKYEKTLNEEIPVAKTRLENIARARALVKAHPNYFGERIRAPKELISNEDYGALETLFGGFVAPQAQEFSTRGLKSALDYAKELKPGFGKKQSRVLGNLDEMEKALKAVLSRKENQLGAGNSSSPVNGESSSNGSKIIKYVRVNGKIVPAQGD